MLGNAVVPPVKTWLDRAAQSLDELDDNLDENTVKVIIEAAVEMRLVEYKIMLARVYQWCESRDEKPDPEWLEALRKMF